MCIVHATARKMDTLFSVFIIYFTINSRIDWTNAQNRMQTAIVQQEEQQIVEKCTKKKKTGSETYAFHHLVVFHNRIDWNSNNSTMQNWESQARAIPSIYLK